jgi:hypothetical protein
MLTLSKIELYGRFKGDSDGFSRSGIDPSAVDMIHNDWREIAELKQALNVIESGLASPAFIAATEAKLLAAVPDEAARTALRAIRE